MINKKIIREPKTGMWLSANHLPSIYEVLGLSPHREWDTTEEKMDKERGKGRGGRGKCSSVTYGDMTTCVQESRASLGNMKPFLLKGKLKEGKGRERQREEDCVAYI